MMGMSGCSLGNGASIGANQFGARYFRRLGRSLGYEEMLPSRGSMNPTKACLLDQAGLRRQNHRRRSTDSSPRSHHFRSRKQYIHDNYQSDYHSNHDYLLFADQQDNLAENELQVIYKYLGRSRMQSSDRCWYSNCAACHETITSATLKRNLLAPEITTPTDPIFYFDSYSTHNWMVGSLFSQILSLHHVVGGD